MRSFRQKVFVSYILLLLLFLALMFPFVTNSVQQIVFRSMSDCADALIADIVVAKNDEELVQILKEHKSQLFYRVGILDSQRRVLYDSHTKRLIGTPFFPLHFVTQSEVEEALQYGTGYSEAYSHLLGQKLVYVAKRFYFHNAPYVIRLAFPFQYIQDLRAGFTVGFLFFGFLLLILFSALASIVLNHFSSPIREIIRAIRNYQEGNLATLPSIQLRTAPNDEFTHLANTVNSLSHQVRSEIESVTKERNEREAILESLAEGVLAVDTNFHVSYANHTALAFFNLSHQIIGAPLPPELPLVCHKLLKGAREQNRLLVDETEVRLNGKRIFLHIVATPRRSGDGAILVLHDTSVQHKMLEMRKAFIANASHELRTPITVIRGFAETLHDNTQLPAETVREVTERIVDHCSRMTTIIKNLLTLADIERLPSSRVLSTDLVQLVSSCISTTCSVWKGVEIALYYPPDESFFVDVDAGLMEMAIHNILDNAAKYSEAPARIEVSLAQEARWVTIAVKDSGMGIPEADFDQIFQRFYRTSQSKKVGGSGLGLSIAETIVHKHYGKIEVQSELGRGSTFTIFLPKNLLSRLHVGA